MLTKRNLLLALCVGAGLLLVLYTCNKPVPPGTSVVVREARTTDTMWFELPPKIIEVKGKVRYSIVERYVHDTLYKDTTGFVASIDTTLACIGDLHIEYQYPHAVFVLNASNIKEKVVTNTIRVDSIITITNDKTTPLHEQLLMIIGAGAIGYAAGKL